jgi:hypothetical protein
MKCYNRAPLRYRNLVCPNHLVSQTFGLMSRFIAVHFVMNVCEKIFAVSVLCKISKMSYVLHWYCIKCRLVIVSRYNLLLRTRLYGYCRTWRQMILTLTISSFSIDYTINCFNQRCRWERGIYSSCHESFVIQNYHEVRLEFPVKHCFCLTDMEYNRTWSTTFSTAATIWKTKYQHMYWIVPKEKCVLVDTISPSHLNFMHADKSWNILAFDKTSRIRKP